MTTHPIINQYKDGQRVFFRANLCDANLCGADLCGANLCGADLCDANLRNANLCDADLCGANLRNANLCGANLCGADLRNANLCDADLCGADLCDADLCGADLCDADLCDANLSRVRGVMHASCCWSTHGECGRRLLAVVIKNETLYFCGCFRGDEKQLRNYINNGDEKYKKSRRKALHFVKSCILESKTQ